MGLPTDQHLPPYARTRYKGSVRKERDRHRAAEHQARLSATSTLTPEVAVTVTPQSQPNTSSNTSLAAVPASTKSTTTVPVVSIPSPSTSANSTAASAVVSPAASASVTSLVTTTTLTPKTAAAPTAIQSTDAKVKTHVKNNFPPIYPCRPVRPFCPPDKVNPLHELPLFLHDLGFKVHVNATKEFKKKHNETVKVFATKMKENPEIILRSQNYEQTFIDFSEDSDKPLYKRIFEHLPIT